MFPHCIHLYNMFKMLVSMWAPIEHAKNMATLGDTLATAKIFVTAPPGWKYLSTWQNYSCRQVSRSVTTNLWNEMNIPAILPSRIPHTTCKATSRPSARTLSKHLHLFWHSAVEINFKMTFLSHNANLSCQQATGRDPPCLARPSGAVALAMLDSQIYSRIFCTFTRYPRGLLKKQTLRVSILLLRQSWLCILQPSPNACFVLKHLKIRRTHRVSFRFYHGHITRFDHNIICSRLQSTRAPRTKRWKKARIMLSMPMTWYVLMILKQTCQKRCYIF